MARRLLLGLMIFCAIFGSGKAINENVSEPLTTENNRNETESALDLATEIPKVMIMGENHNETKPTWVQAKKEDIYEIHEVITVSDHNETEPAWKLGKMKDFYETVTDGNNITKPITVENIVAIFGKTTAVFAIIVVIIAFFFILHKCKRQQESPSDFVTLVNKDDDESRQLEALGTDASLVTKGTDVCNNKKGDSQAKDQIIENNTANDNDTQGKNSRQPVVQIKIEQCINVGEIGTKSTSSQNQKRNWRNGNGQHPRNFNWRPNFNWYKNRNRFNDRYDRY